MEGDGCSRGGSWVRPGTLPSGGKPRCLTCPACPHTPAPNPLAGSGTMFAYHVAAVKELIARGVLVPGKSRLSGASRRSTAGRSALSLLPHARALLPALHGWPACLRHTALPLDSGVPCCPARASRTPTLLNEPPTPKLQASRAAPGWRRSRAPASTRTSSCLPSWEASAAASATCPPAALSPAPC